MDDAVEFDPAKVLSDRRFGTVSVRKTKNGLFWFTCIINGEGKRTTSYDLLSDAIRHVEKLRRRCRSHPHLDFTSNFESPFLTLANFKATRSLELRQKGDEDIDEAEADGTEEAEADGIEEAEACIEKKVEEQVQKLYYQTEHVSLFLFFLCCDSSFAEDSYSSTDSRRRTNAKKPGKPGFQCFLSFP